ncbi:MAG: cob(I)yrinic acid a,c-diamide adenosyltransferase [Chthonomonadales bacterium]
MAHRIYTRTGDDGSTGLPGGGRVAKDHIRMEALGTLDELNSFLGAACTAADAQETAALLRQIQGRLLTLGADVAGTTPAGLREDAVQELERHIDRMEAVLPPLTRFILPGGCPLAAMLHVARSVCRRAERCIVRLAHSEPVNPWAIAFLNRLSDLLFVAARFANHSAGHPDILWYP